MKKLIVAATIVCAAAIAQAGAVSWSSAKLYDINGDAVKKTVGVSVYLLASETAYNNLTDVWGTYGEDALAGGKGASAHGTTSGTGSKLSAITTPGDATTTYYAAIVSVLTMANGDQYYITEKKSLTTGEDGNASYSAIASAANSVAGGKTAWTAANVPEPTSAMLLLLGMAGLALRRRRA